MCGTMDPDSGTADDVAHSVYPASLYKEVGCIDHTNQIMEGACMELQVHHANEEQYQHNNALRLCKGM